MTGASGGVGGTALAILAERGYEVWAATGKPDEAARLTRARRGRDPDPGRGDRRGQAARVGALGRGRRRGRRRRRCPYVLRTLRTGGGRRVQRQRRRARSSTTTVFPFILRGVALLGMDSVNMPIDRRRWIWDRLATDLRPRDLGVHCQEVTLDTLDAALDAIVAGEARGRWIVRVARLAPRRSSLRSCASARSKPAPGVLGRLVRERMRRDRLVEGQVAVVDATGEVHERGDRRRLRRRRTPGRRGRRGPARRRRSRAATRASAVATQSSG